LEINFCIFTVQSTDETTEEMNENVMKNNEMENQMILETREAEETKHPGVIPEKHLVEAPECSIESDSFTKIVNVIQNKSEGKFS
jgi:hypothetical protein